MAEKTLSVKFDCLPDVLVRDILLRLPVKSIIMCKSVSKSWLAITTDPSFLRAHTDCSPYYLLIHTSKGRSWDSNHRSFNLHLLSAAPTPSDYSIFVYSAFPERRRSTMDVVYASCDGLICLRDRICGTQEEAVPRYYVINPLTGRRLIDVPNPSFSGGHLLGLYLHPPTGEYRLIWTIDNETIHNNVELITPSEESRRTTQLSLSNEIGCGQVPIVLKGYLYWIAYYVNEPAVLVFDTTKEEFKLMPLPVWDKLHYTKSSLFHMGERLGVSTINSDLSSAYKLCVDTWVLKDHETAEWEKMHSVTCSGDLKIIDF